MSRRAEHAALAAMIALYASIASVVCAIKYHAFLYDDIDLAIFTQALANLMRGSLDCSIRGASWLGDHSSLNLFLLAPLYALARTPLTLLIVQSVALALGALPVHRLARRELGDGRAALACATLYLMYPALGFLNLFEFHPEALSTPCLLAAFASLREGRTRATALWAALALLGKEDVALVVAAMGLYALAARRRENGRAQAAWLLALAVASLVLSFGVLKPALAGGAPDYGAMYSQWGRTPSAVFAALLRAPHRAIAALFATAGNAHDSLLKQQYWLQLLLPLAFLPLVAPEVFAIALPIVFEHLLSWRSQQHGIVYQYTALVIPFALAAAIVGAGRVSRAIAARGGAAANGDEGRALAARASARPPATGDEHRALTASARPPAIALRVALLALLACVASQWAFGPAGTGVLLATKPLEHVRPTEYDRAMEAAKRRMIAEIPAQGGVVAGFELLAPLAARPELHSLHHVVSGTYTFSNRMFPIPGGVTAMIADWSSERLAIYPNRGTGTRLRAVVEHNGLVPVEAIGDLVLYRRAGTPALALVEPVRADSAARAITFDGELAFLGAALPDRPTAPGAPLSFATQWWTVAPVDRAFLTEWLVLDADGRVVLSRMRFLGYLVDPPVDWPIGAAMREHYSLPLPATLAAGRYRLAMRVGAEGGGRVALSVASDPGVARDGGVVPLGEFEVATPVSPR